MWVFCEGKGEGVGAPPPARRGPLSRAVDQAPALREPHAAAEPAEPPVLRGDLNHGALLADNDLLDICGQDSPKLIVVMLAFGEIDPAADELYVANDVSNTAVDSVY